MSGAREVASCNVTMQSGGQWWTGQKEQKEEKGVNNNELWQKA